MGIDVPAVQNESGEFVKLWLDWSERRFHLASNLGNALYRLFIEKGWLVRSSQNRNVKTIALGREKIEEFRDN